MSRNHLVKVAMLAATVALALGGADAEGCVPSTANPEVDTGPTPAGRYYVDDDGSLCEPCSISIWVYAESNGIDGLQRHDDVRDNTCGGAIPGDTIIL